MKVKDFLKQISSYKEKYPDNNVEEYEIIFKDNKQDSEDNYIDISYFLDDVKKFTLGSKNLAASFKTSSDHKKPPIVKAEESYQVCASQWAVNGLIELEVLLPKDIVKDEYMLTFVALDDVVYNNNVVFNKGKKLHYYSMLHKHMPYDNYNITIKAVLDVRPTLTFDSDFEDNKMSNFSILTLVNKAQK